MEFIISFVCGFFLCFGVINCGAVFVLFGGMILILSFNICSTNAFSEISYEWETIGYSKESLNTILKD
jgi:hypothetical protein